MRSGSPTLKTHLAGGQFTVADLLLITLADGVTEYALTNASNSIVYDGKTWTPLDSDGKSIQFKVGRIRQSMELEVDKVEIEMGNPTLGGKKLSVLVTTGVLDGATVEVSKLFTQANGTPIEAVLLFAGDLSVPEPNATECRLTVRSVLRQLENDERPLRVVQPGCPWNVYDARCGLTKANFTTTHTIAYVGVAPNDKRLVTPVPATAIMYPGWITWKTGTNKGQTRMIRSNAAGALTLATPLPYTPALGDEVEVVRGCPKTRVACLNTFNNLNRFGSFPDVPRNRR